MIKWHGSKTVRTATAGMAFAVPLFSLKKKKKYLTSTLINSFLIIVPSTCCTNSNLIFEKALASGGFTPDPHQGDLPLESTGCVTFRPPFVPYHF